MRVRVEASARLHLGMLDLNGDLGRKFGSLGVAIAHPRVVLEASPSPHLIVDGLEQERTEAFARRFLSHYRLVGGAHIAVQETIPSHVGLGCGTQLGLATGVALARLHEVQAGLPELARAMGRGRRSGIGIAAFEQGGFIVDAGQSIHGAENETRSCPPIVFRHAFPDDWMFIVVVPPVQQGLSGVHEDRAFQDLPPASQEQVGCICRLLVMGLLPALIERDIEGFGEALTQIQRLVGETFAPVQGGIFAHPVSSELITYMLEAGAKGAGQSSWGPAVYGLVEGQPAAETLEARVRTFFGPQTEVQVFRTRPNNRGHVVRTINCHTRR